MRLGLRLVLSAIAIFALGAVGANAQTGSADTVNAPAFASIFSDHAVLQRDRPIAVWGTGQPGGTITVKFATTQLQLSVDTNGYWYGFLPAMPASGPFTLSTSNGTATQVLNDVMVGDVFLCGGQSNMEFPLKLSTGQWTPGFMAPDPTLRFIIVPRDSAPEPRTAFSRPAHWEVAGSEATGEASAVCYYMSKAITTDQNVTVGMIDSYWGGTIIESWTSADGLKGKAEYDSRLFLLSQFAHTPDTAAAKWNEETRDAWKSTEPDLKAAQAWVLAGFNDSAWPSTKADGIWEGWGVPELADFDGVVWMRTEVMLTAAQARLSAVLDLGLIDDADVTWINGEPVGHTVGWDTLRHYPVNEKILKAGRNVIVVRVSDTGGGGGLTGQPAIRRLSLSNGEDVPLSGLWRYHIAGALKPSAPAPDAPWTVPNGLTNLYNGMIAPLAPYTLKGVAWFQGEANVPGAAAYEELLTGLMADWRKTFNDPELPFLITQLSAYGPVAAQPGRSDWARLRDAQRRAVATDAHSSLVVTVDFGDRTDIHPPEKRVIGQRLARAAGALIYHKPIASGGPSPLAVTRDGADLVVHLGNTGGKLITYSADAAIGFEVCGQGEDCTFAMGKPEANTVILTGANTSGSYKVRYAWADAPYVNLYSVDDLPAEPFEMDIH